MPNCTLYTREGLAARKPGLAVGDYKQPVISRWATVSVWRCVQVSADGLRRPYRRYYRVHTRQQIHYDVEKLHVCTTAGPISRAARTGLTMSLRISGRPGSARVCCSWRLLARAPQLSSLFLSSRRESTFVLRSPHKHQSVLIYDDLNRRTNRRIIRVTTKVCVWSRRYYNRFRFAASNRPFGACEIKHWQLTARGLSADQRNSRILPRVPRSVFTRGNAYASIS